MIQLSFVYGATTLNLQANGIRVLDGYYPASGKERASLTEQIELLVTGTSAERLAAVESIRAALRNARDYPSGSNCTYLHYAVDGTETAWRSRVMDGDVDFDERLNKRWQHGRLRVHLVVQRDPFWEATAETAVSIANGNGSGTGGIRVYSYGGHAVVDTSYYKDNWIDIAAGVIDGDLPAPVRLEFQNYRCLKMRMGVQHKGDPDGVTGHFADAGAKAFSGTTLSSLDYFSLTAAQLAAMDGYYRVIARLTSHGAYTDLLLSAGFYLYGRVFFGPQINAYLKLIVDLGVIRIPPAELDTTDVSLSILLSLYGQRRTAGSHSVAFDSLQLIPADSYAEFSFPSDVVPYLFGASYRAYYNSYLGGEAYQEYLDGGTTWKVERMYMTRGGLYLEPGKQQRIWFQPFAELSPNVTDSGYWIQKLWYRPRKAAL